MLLRQEKQEACLAFTKVGQLSSQRMEFFKGRQRQLFLFPDSVVRYCWGLEAPLHRAESPPFIQLSLRVLVWKMKMTCVSPPDTPDSGHTPVPALSGPRMCLLNDAQVDAWQFVAALPGSQAPQAPSRYLLAREAHRAGSRAHAFSIHPKYSWLIGQRDVRHPSHLCIRVSGMTRTLGCLCCLGMEGCHAQSGVRQEKK